MRAVIQRVTHASVTINGQIKSQIGAGYLILLGVCNEDTSEDVEWLVKKIANLRVFDDEDGVMNRSILDCHGEALVISQFTLYASYKKGNRPSWFKAGSHEHSIPLYEAFCKQLSEAIGKPVGTGEFGADMNKRQITNYVNFTALILYIIGRVIHMGILCWIGLGIMTLSSIWTIIHWKENDKMSNYISVAFLILVGLSIFGL